MEEDDLRGEDGSSDSDDSDSSSSDSRSSSSSDEEMNAEAHEELFKLEQQVQFPFVLSDMLDFVSFCCIFLH